ncbi:MAG TPA: VWA domain-containing protein [Methylomirabilota bacterium]|nr:VWA domain-containing protein [Methylomirabilota bacterium]
MKLQFTDPAWLLLLPPTLAAIVWLTIKSNVALSPWRRWTALGIRVLVCLCLVLALAGLQWLRPLDGLNVYFLLDRSDSVPSAQQEAAREYVNKVVGQKEKNDKAGVLVFGTDSALETTLQEIVDVKKIQAIISTERTDLASALRLGTAAFPENGQKRLVLLSDGNENMGDAISAVLASKPLGVSVDVVPLGAARADDVSIQKLSLPNTLKKGQTFEVKMFAQANTPQKATLRLYRNDQHMASQEIDLAAGKNLFTFPQSLQEPGFYSYDIQLEGTRDQLPQNNRAVNFTYVQGNPTILLVSSAPDADATLAAALRESKVDVKVVDVAGFPSQLAEMQTYDAIFLSNVAAGDLGRDLMLLLESAVRDFGVGLVAIGGDQAFAAGGYRNTPLETTLPVDMELSSKKVMPSGALVLVVHATEFPNGNQWARDIAYAALNALGPQDEMGVVLWDGTERWLYDLQKVGDKKKMGQLISGMQPGDMLAFGGVMEKAYDALRGSKSSLKHMVVFSDGDPSPPTDELMNNLTKERITLSTVMIGGHVMPDPMLKMATQGRGRFYDVRSPAQLPQIFVKESSVILKSAIFEEPFKPKMVSSSEPLRGISAAELPQLLGYVATSPKPRAETPLVSQSGDPILAHWQYGLGRAVAFTSDAKARWGQNWLSWPKYRQFWSQVAQWSMRKIENADFAADITVEKGQGHISVEAIDGEGNFRNFLNLETVIVTPKGERQVVRLQQTGPGHYEADFPTRDVGAYIMNLIERRNGQIAASQVLGASVNYSPEFASAEPNLNLLQRISQTGGGQMLDVDSIGKNPFNHDRRKTYQPNDLFEWLLRFAIILFPLDVGIRRIQIDRAEWLKATANLRRMLLFWKARPRAVESDEAMGALLARKQKVRTTVTAKEPEVNPELFKPTSQPAKGVEPAPIIQSTSRSATATMEKEAKPAPGKEEPANTASRLLAAKKRAQKK